MFPIYGGVGRREASMNTTSESPAAALNRELGARFFAEQDRLKGGPADALCTGGYQAYLGGNPPVDRAGHEYFAKMFYAAFEGIHHTIEDVFATDDRIAVRFVLRGRHTGTFFGIPASGREVTIAANVLMHVADGKVSRLFGIFDEAGLLRQIGVLPG
jgi:predicted ester cyclase